MSSSESPPHANEGLHTSHSNHSGNFRTRSLAVPAAHRSTSSSSHLHEPPPPPASHHRAHHHHSHGQPHPGHSTSSLNIDIEANPLASPASAFSTRSPLSPKSPKSTLSSSGLPSIQAGHGTGVRHRRRSHHRNRDSTKYRWLNTSAVAGGTGDEPGVDVKSKRDEEAYGHLKAKTHVKIVDYSSNPNEDGMNLTCDFPGERLREWLDGEHGKRRLGEDGKPYGVRWIHVDGVSWEVVKTLVLHYGLHPLAVEDSLRATNTPRSKLDFYKNHLYLQLLIHHTSPSDEAKLSLVADEMAEGRGGGYPNEFTETDGEGDGNESTNGENSMKQRKGGIREWFSSKKQMTRLPEGVEGVFEPSVVSPRHGGDDTHEKQAHTLTVNELSAKYMVPIRRGILSVFMLRDGTLISMDSKPTREVLAPIYGRLADEQSLLRRSGDVSMLAEAILDTVVDLSIEISQTFESEILKLEASVLVDPQMETVRHLHVLSSQLIRLKRSLTPLLHVCYIVRDQEIQRSAAASAIANPREKHQNGSLFGENHHLLAQPQSALGYSFGQTPNLAQYPSSGSNTPTRASFSGPSGAAAVPPGGGGDNNSVMSFAMTPTPTNGLGGMASTGVGFFSPLTKVYIGDVIDHLEIIVGSLEQFGATCEHLTDYVFNVLSFQTNASMERLSIVTVVFLPLTFIASYFGMNFTDFSQLQGPVSYFWKVAIPCTAAFFLTFSYGYLKVYAETSSRKIGRWRRTRAMGAGRIRGSGSGRKGD
ncbi:hypothetical protein IAR55_006690 [Kwoniella newhampshirensis]|uniref:Magnesium transporter n=1 Tax=Kwoniella newhampshirensis TaxID=1651941 RepID=A0AAW0YFU1_9TREE